MFSLWKSFIILPEFLKVNDRTVAANCPVHIPQNAPKKAAKK
jgi:hypothetical protein